MKIESFRELVVWQKSMLLARSIYDLTKKYPREEIYGLVSQMRRAAVSIPSNIAEGYQRRNRKEYLQFLGISYGSAAELETQLILSQDLSFLDKEIAAENIFKIVEIQKMLNSMMDKLSATP